MLFLQGDDIAAKPRQQRGFCFSGFSVVLIQQIFSPLFPDLEAGGSILACGTYLKICQSEGSEIFPVSTMHDLYMLIRDSDKILSF
jgi:hypothetical protein